MPVILNLEDKIINLIRNERYKWFTTGVNLGGVTGPSGGTGGPIGGFTGQLPQSKVTFDTSENEIWTIPVSGESLVTNLDRIRYRIATVESGGGISYITVRDEGIDQGQVTILDFEGDSVTATVSGSVATITISGITGSGGASYLDDLVDVTIVSPTAGDFLYYHTTSGWINMAGGDIGIHDAVTVVDTSSLNLELTGQALSGYVLDNSHAHVEANITDLEHDAIKLQTRTVASTAPTQGQALVWNSVSSQWEPGNVAASGVGVLEYSVYFEDLTTQVPGSGFDLSYAPVTDSLQVHVNGMQQQPDNYYLSDSDTFILKFTTVSGDEVLAQYLRQQGSFGLDIYDEGILTVDNATEMDFVGTGVTVTASGVRAVVTVTASGGAGHDAVTVTDTSSVNLELTGQALSGYVIPGGVDHDQLLNFASNEHFTEASIDHTNIQNIGTTSHDDIDAHIASGYIHTPSGHIHDDRYYTESEVDGLLHSAVTVVDTATLNLELTGQALSGYVIASGINLGELGDVSVAGVSQGEVLTYDGGDWIPSGVSAGTLDHGELSGLGDDDHTIYLTSGRADAWFFNQSHTNLQDIGTNSHTTIDSHIADTSIHFDELAELSDVSAAAPDVNDSLVWTGSIWAPVAISGGASGQAYILEDLTGQVPDTGDDFWLSNTIMSGSLRVYYNGLIQQPTNYIETSASGFHTYFSPVANDELFAQYLVNDLSGSAVVGTIQVEKDDAVIQQRVAIINFEGSGLQNVVDNGSNKVTVTISGGGVADHGLLAGLGDDDHPQYFLLAGETTAAQLHSGANLDLYSDAGSTLTLRLYGSTGNISTIGSVYTGNITSFNPIIIDPAGSLTLDPGTTVEITADTNLAANLDVSGNITVSGTVDTVDIASFKSSYDSHVADTSIHFDELGELSDVSISGVVQGEALTYDGSVWIASGISGGTLDHGSLTGLGDDDHTQYVLRQPTANTIINESGGDFDLRIESDNVENMLFMDAGSDQIAIGTATADQHESLTISNVGQKAGGGTYDTSWVNEYTGMVLGPTGSDAGSLYLLALRGNTTDIYNNIGTNIYWNPESGDISWHKRDASKHALTYEQKVTPAGAWHEFWYIPSGTTTLNSLAYFGDSIAVFNDANRDVDFRIAGDTVTNVFVVDGGLDAVQFGNFTEYKEVSEPGTPTSTWGRVYAKSDGYLYYKNDGGTEYNLVASGGAALGDSWITEDVTSQVPDAGDDFWLSNTIASGTLAVYYNGLLQQPTNYAETSASGFHTYFSPVANDELVAQYLVENVTGGVVVGTIQVEKDDAVIHSNAAILNFEGVQNITDEGSGKVTITISGGAVGDHGALTGLADDDHTQYAHLSQDEAILGQWNFHSDLEQRAYYGDTVYTRTTISGGLYHVTDSSTGFDSTVVLRGNIVNIQGNGGQELVELDPTEVTFNDPGNDVDFRIKTNNNNAMLFVDGGADDIIIGDDVHPTGGVISTDENKWISTEGGYNYLAFSSIDSTLPLNTVTYYAARGTVASPSATQLNDYFMIMGARGYDDAGWDSTTASIIMQAAENWDATGHGTKMIFEVTPSGATSREDVLRLGDDTGNLSYMVSLPAVTSTETLTQDIAGLAWGDVLGSDHHSTLQHLHYGTNGYHGAFSIWGVNQYWNEEADAWAQKDSTKYGNVLQLWNRENAAHTGFSFLYTVSGYPQNFAYWITGQSDDGQGTENAWVRINETNYDMDFIVEGENDSALLYVDASADKVGIGTNTPQELLHVDGDILSSGSAVKVTGAYPSLQLYDADQSYTYALVASGLYLAVETRDPGFATTPTYKPFTLNPTDGPRFTRFVATGGSTPQASATFTSDKSGGTISDGFGAKMAFRAADDSGVLHWQGGLAYAQDFTNDRSEAQLLIKSGASDTWATTQVMTADYAEIVFNGPNDDRDFRVASVGSDYGIYMDAANNRWGFGTNNLNSYDRFVIEHDVGGAGDNTRFIKRAYTAGGGTINAIQIATAEGDHLVPSGITDNTLIGRLEFAGYYPSAFEPGARIGVYTRQDWTSSVQGSAMLFETTLVGGTSPVEFMRFDGDGYIAFNVFNNDINFSIDGDTQDNLFFVDAGTDKVLVGGSTTGQGTNFVVYEPSAALGSMSIESDYAAANSIFGALYFVCEDILTNRHAYAYIQAETGSDYSDDQGILRFYVSGYTSGAGTRQMLTLHGGDTGGVGNGEVIVNEDGIDFSFRVETSAQTDSFHVDGPTGYVTIHSVKTTTGDPTGNEGLIYYNTVDNAVKMYADGAWRTLASW